MPSNNAVYNYDQLGRLVSVTFLDGAMVSYSYDLVGNRQSVVEVAASSASCCPPTITAFPKRITADLNNNPMVVLLSDGSLIGWGDNTTGVLCNGLLTASNSPPQRLTFNPNTTVPPSTATVVDWAFTNANLYVVFSNGWVYSGGSNGYGQLGQGDTTNRPYLTRIEYFVTNSLSITNVWAAGGYSTSSGGGCVYFQATDYSMYGCGLNVAGNLGNASTPTSNVTTPAPCAGIGHTTNHVINVVVTTEGTNSSCYMLFNDGTLFVAGYNGQGQLGIGSTTGVSGAFVTAKKTGSVAISNAASISGNAASTTAGNALIVDNSGNVWTTGYNAHGELGQGNTTNLNLFTQVSALSSIATAELGGGLYGFGYAINTSGTLYTWGYNAGNNLFKNSTTSPQSTPAAAPDVPTGVVQKVFISKGEEGLSTTQQMVLLMTSGVLAYAGADVGQLGVNNVHISGAYNLIPEPKFITDGTDSISDLYLHGNGLNQRWFILTTLGNLYACGDNTDGICTGCVEGVTPAANTVWSRISFVS